jgi:hypothetical protein
MAPGTRASAGAQARLQLLNDPEVEVRCGAARAAALHRSDGAFEWLLIIIETGTAKLSGVAADALAVYERNTRLIEQVTAAKARRKEN